MKNFLLKITLIGGLVASWIGVQAQIYPGANGPIKVIQGTNRAGVGSKITVNTLFDKDTIYILKNYVRVSCGATLTIEPGTIIMAAAAPIDTSCLIIEKGAQINANGTAALPIVFTSAKQVGTRNRGDWGGLVICGNAVNNQGVNVPLPGNFGAFHGGTNNHDNSGMLRFVRVEFAGMYLGLGATNQIAGITLASVGKCTVFRNIQVAHSGTDSYHWLGGQVAGTNLISWKPTATDFKANLGYGGYNQFGLAYRDSEIASHLGASAFNINEIDATLGDNAPKTNCVFSNFEAWGPVNTVAITRINPFYSSGAQIYKYAEVDFYNTLIIGFPSNIAKNIASGFFVYDTKNIVNDSIKIRCNVVAAYGNSPKGLLSVTGSSWAPFASPENIYNKSAYRNTILANMLLNAKKAPLKYEPLFTLVADAPIGIGSSFITASVVPALPVANYPNGFTSVPFRGAFGGTDWAADWSEYRANLMVYTAGLPTRKAIQEDFLANGTAAAGNSVLCMPNPTVGATTINFSFDMATIASVAVVDMAGTSLYAVDANFNQGVNTVDFDAANLAAGTYLVKVSANGALLKTGKLQVVR